MCTFKITMFPLPRSILLFVYRIFSGAIHRKYNKVSESFSTVNRKNMFEDEFPFHRLCAEGDEQATAPDIQERGASKQ